MKVAIWIIVGSVVSIGLVLGIGGWLVRKEINKKDPGYLMELLKTKAERKKAALLIRYNGESWTAIHPDEPLPLASTVKIIIAVEYARQAAEGLIDPDQEVSLQELDSFYIPRTDGGAHSAWLEQLGPNTDKVSLREVAKGMIAYSSNANTDYLMSVLGLDNINKVPETLGMAYHEPLYPIGSTLYLPLQLMREKGLTKQEAGKALESICMEEYRTRAMDLFDKWLVEPPTEEDKKQILEQLDMAAQRLWSDRLPRSTARDYADLMQKLNQKSFYSQAVYDHLDPVMEQVMNHPRNREWLDHGGQKGGSTAFVHTMAMYATDREGNRLELTFLFDDLTPVEQAKLSRNGNDFLLNLLKNEAFRTRVKNELYALCFIGGLLWA